MTRRCASCSPHLQLARSPPRRRALPPRVGAALRHGRAPSTHLSARAKAGYTDDVLGVQTQRLPRRHRQRRPLRRARAGSGVRVVTCCRATPLDRIDVWHAFGTADAAAASFSVDDAARAEGAVGVHRPRRAVAVLPRQPSRPPHLQVRGEAPRRVPLLRESTRRCCKATTTAAGWSSAAASTSHRFTPGDRARRRADDRCSRARPTNRARTCRCC